MQQKILVNVERSSGKNNFSCYAAEPIGTFRPSGYGSTAKEAVADLVTCIEEMRQLAAERGQTFPEETELVLSFDIGAFFNYYPIDATSFARYIGMTPSLLRQYVTAIRRPRPEQLEKIRNGIARLSHELRSCNPIGKTTANGNL